MTKSKEIKIKWAKEYSGQLKDVEVKNKGGGIYQLCGQHPVYSKDKEEVLLYIAQIKDRFDEKIEQHIKNEYLSRRVPKILRPKTVTIYLGQVNTPGVDLEEIKKILVFVHSPAWNAKYIRQYRKNPGRKYEIEISNFGKYGDLMPKIKEKDIL